MEELRRRRGRAFYMKYTDTTARTQLRTRTPSCRPNTPTAYGSVKGSSLEAPMQYGAEMRDSDQFQSRFMRVSVQFQSDFIQKFVVVRFYFMILVVLTW